MAKTKTVFLEFVRLVVKGDIDDVSGRLADTPSLTIATAEVGAARQSAPDFFFTEIAHCLYVGDTALHMAAAAFRRPIAELLIAHGADCRAKNRRGAEPLHYATGANRFACLPRKELFSLLAAYRRRWVACKRPGVAYCYINRQWPVCSDATTCD